MKREIKFRAWDGGQMYEHHDVWPFARGNKIVLKIDMKEPNPDPDQETYTQLPQCELMQFTGLTDKNGKEMYEGDILKGPHSPRSTNSLKMVVEWRGGAWRVEASNKDRLIWSMCPYVEVIGNIYENPELLTS